MEKSALGKGKEQDWGMVILKSDLARNEFPVSYLACGGAKQHYQKERGSSFRQVYCRRWHLFSCRCLKLERPSQLEMFSGVICLALGNKAEEIKIMNVFPLLSWWIFCPTVLCLSSSCSSGTYVVGILQRKDGKAQDQSHSCSGLDMTYPDSTSSKRFSVLS